MCTFLVIVFVEVLILVHAIVLQVNHNNQTLSANKENNIESILVTAIRLQYLVECDRPLKR